MEVDLLQRRAVNIRLRQAQPLKQLLRPGPAGSAQGGLVDERGDFGERAVNVTVPAFVPVIVRVIVSVLVRMGMRMGMRVRMLAFTMMRVSVRLHEVFAPDAELRGPNAGACDAFGPHRIRGNRQAAERPADIRERHAGVDERAEHHVARCAREAIEVENPQIPTILSAILWRHLAGFHERVVALVRKDEVIEHVDPDDMARLHQPGGQDHVIGAGMGIS